MVVHFVRLALVCVFLSNFVCARDDWVPQRPIVQRPLDGFRREILSCSLPLNHECQSKYGKRMSSYCHCAENLKCVKQKCIRAKGISEETEVLEGSIRIDEVDEGSEEPVEIPFDPINMVQRPMGHDGEVIMACSLPLGSECQSTRGKTMESYCSCAEGLTCANHICVRTDPEDSSPVLTEGITIDEVAKPKRKPIRQRPLAAGRKSPPRQRSCRRQPGESCRLKSGCPCIKGFRCRNEVCTEYTG